MTIDLTEKAFQKQVIDLAHMLHWKVAHFRPAQTARGWRTPVEADGKGFPDLILARNERLLAAELKVGRNKPSLEQDDWLQKLGAAGVDTYVWRPEDLAVEILDVLR